MKIVSLLLLTHRIAATFTVPTKLHRSAPLFAVSADIKDTFYQAVQLAEQGEKQIDLEEFDRLATELEEYEGCRYEQDSGFCDKEIQDRIDVAEILRMQIELQLRYVTCVALMNNMMSVLDSHSYSIDWIISRVPTCLPMM